MLTLLLVALLIYATNTMNATIIKVERSAIPIGSNPEGYYDAAAFTGLYNTIMKRGGL